MHLLFVFARTYPRRILIVLSCLFLAALAEGVGLSSLLPLLGLAAQISGDPQGVGAQRHSQFDHFLRHALALVGLQPTVELLLFVIASGMLLKALLILLAQQQIGYAVAQVATDLRLALIRGLLAARWEYYVRQPVGALVNAFATEATRAAQAYLYAATILTLFIQVLLYTAIALFVSWQATVGAIAIGAVIIYTLNRLVHWSRRAGARQTTLLNGVSVRLTDVLCAVKPLKAMAREALAGPLLEGATQRLQRAFQHEVLSKEMLRGLQEPLVVVALISGLYGALIHWSLPLDRVIVLAVLFGQLLSSLNKVQRQYQFMAAHESAFWSLRAAIARAARERDSMDGARTPTLNQEIALTHVQLSYGEQVVLRDVSLIIPAGGVTAIIGPSGAGKTSVADLILGLVRPQAGDVWIDDVPLREVDIRRWRQMVGYVPQELFLLHDSVFVNVTLGDPDLTPLDVEAALCAVGAWEFIAPLPEGIYTPVGERGARFSGGQRQRIAIARALVHKPQVLILDEATAALDPESEAAVCATVQQLRGTMTILVISHQPALLDVADRLYHLEHGQVRLVDARHPYAQEAS